MFTEHVDIQRGAGFGSQNCEWLWKICSTESILGESTDNRDQHMNMNNVHWAYDNMKW